MRINSQRGVVAIAFLSVWVSSVAAVDWPMWRFDAGRSAATPEELPAELRLVWRCDLGPNHVAWSEDPRLQFDASYEPIVLGDMLYVASARSDCVTAFDTASGELRWTFRVGGPVRLAPVGWQGKLYFGADDGHFYCLDAASGRLVWKFSAAPNKRLVLGNERLISVWPVRGGPVPVGDKLYFTAGIWPFEGTELFALDLSAETSPHYTAQMLDDFAPQGYLAASDGKLLIPGGRAVAASIDLATGARVTLGYTHQKETDYHVVGSGSLVLHGGKIYDAASGGTMAFSAIRPIISGDMVYCPSQPAPAAPPLIEQPPAEQAIVAYDTRVRNTVTTKDRRGRDIIDIHVPVAWKLEMPGSFGEPLRLDMLAGGRLYGHHGRKIFAVELPTEGRTPRVDWTWDLESVPSTMLAANGRLIAVTPDGKVHCFAAVAGEGVSPDVVEHSQPFEPAAAVDPAVLARARACLELVDDPRGYAVVMGIGDASLIQALLAESQLQLIVFDTDSQKAESLRHWAEGAGVYGSRLSVMDVEPGDVSLPPYLAHLVVCESLPSESEKQQATVAGVFDVLRPYGGVGLFPAGQMSEAFVAEAIAARKLEGAEAMRKGEWTIVRRSGPLAGAADWTHEYGDASNSLMSQDKRVRAPMGILWFGGPASRGELYFNRHYWGPGLTVVGGRMFVQGVAGLTAVDIYTGRVLWNVPIREGSGPGRQGNFFEQHKPGFHYVAVDDGVYLVYPEVCLRLDPRTGQTLSELKIPEGSQFGKVRVEEKLLIATVFQETPEFGSIAKGMAGIDRYSGDVIWYQDARLSCPISAVGNGKVYFYDGHLKDFYDSHARKGKVPEAFGATYVRAIDAQTGEPLWEQASDRILTWMAYSEEHGVVISSNKDGIDARRGDTGEALWTQDVEAPGFGGHPESVWDKVIVSDDLVIDQRGPGRAYGIKTGAVHMDKHPVTGEPVPWEFTKTGHHCNYAIASPHLLTFRAGVAGFFDRATQSTARLAGFRSGCRNSLIPAGGVLNAPNYAHGCTCGFNIFTSLALVHIPEVDLWTYNAYRSPQGQVERLGINFGAPGDRLAEDGTLWMEYPFRGDPSATVETTVDGSSLRWYRMHSSQVAGGPLTWVGASGVENLTAVRVKLPGDGGSGKYTVRLYFAEPDDLDAGKRQLDVRMQGKPAITGLDITESAGGPRRLVCREVPGVEIAGELLLELSAARGRTLLCGLQVEREAGAAAPPE